MAKPLHGRIRILLLAAMTTGLATLPPHLTAQAGSGEPGRALGARVEEARKGPFHLSTGPVLRTFRTVAPGVGIGMADTQDMSWRPAPAPDSTVSPKRVFAFILAGATIPLIPAMILEGSYAWGNPTNHENRRYQALSAALLGGLATLVTVPAAAVAAGFDSLPRTLVGTVVGFAAGVGSWFLPVIGHPFWAIPVFSVAMASVTTFISTVVP